MSVISRHRELVRAGRLLPFDSYDMILIQYSGGKDSNSLVIALQDQGAPVDKMELWHQHVDGAPESLNGQPYRGLMDWPCTATYVHAAADGFGIPLFSQWRDGGIEAEMYRENATTNGVYFETGDHELQYLPPSSRAGKSTRRKWPAKGSNLMTRWCSAYAKIDVAARAIANDPRFKDANILFITGERREESAARSRYDEAEDHRCSGKRRRVDHWRPVIDWKEQHVWDAMKQRNIMPHPAYRLGYGRLSCQHCIFIGADEWATSAELDLARFERVAEIEKEFGHTINAKKSGDKVVPLPVIELQRQGTPFAQLRDTELGNLALGEYPQDQFFCEGAWELPAGAFGNNSGPT